jgi:cysteine desulfurase
MLRHSRNMRLIYLDYNATTPVAPAVQEAMLPFLAEHYGNPSSGHSLGRACHEAVEDARARVAQLLGADSDEIVFTSCGTESNNLALKGVALRAARGGTGHLVISALEHPAVAQPAAFLERLGYSVSVVPCDTRGVIDPLAVHSALRRDTVLVSVMHANNEIGTIQPLREIAEMCRDRGVLIHTDAAQSVGKTAVRVKDLGVDLLTVAGHKIYAPKGIGALYVRRGIDLEPVLHGAGHERGLRAGTENVPYIVGLGRAASLIDQHLTETIDRLAMLRHRLWARLEKAIDGVSYNGQGAERLPNTLSVNFPFVNGAALLGRCPELCASTGAACHSGSAHMSATLQAIGLRPEVARGTVRLSVGWYTNEDEVDRAANLLIAAWEYLHGRME